MNELKNMNWGIIVVLLGTIGIWYAIYKIGFFLSLMYIVIGAAIGGIITAVKEQRWW